MLSHKMISSDGLLNADVVKAIVQKIDKQITDEQIAECQKEAFNVGSDVCVIAVAGFECLDSHVQM